MKERGRIDGEAECDNENSFRLSLHSLPIRSTVYTWGSWRTGRGEKLSRTKEAGLGDNLN